MATLAGSPTAMADTPVRETSCAEAAIAASAYQLCVQYFGTSFCSTPDTSLCWDFEGSLGGFTTAGTAFANQPTVGDNVAAWRVLQTKASTMTAGKTMLDEMNAIGGDYWNTAYPIGNQGKSWLGTYENRPTGASPWGGVQGDGPTGTATSQGFVIDRQYLEFLIGGGCDLATEKLELQLYQPPFTLCSPLRGGGQICHVIPGYWVTASDANGNTLAATGACDEELRRDTFDTSSLAGRIAHIVITDASSGAWGHINVDHILLTDRPADDNDGKNIPIWGFADTHAHLDNEHSSLSFNGGHMIQGGVGSITTNPFLLATELPACDGAAHGGGTSKASVAVEHIEAASLGSAPGLPLGCTTDDNTCSTALPTDVGFTTGSDTHWANGFGPIGNNLIGWPYWYTRVHQQMHLTWIQRAYAGGQRLMVVAAGNTEAFGFALGADEHGDYLSDYGALRRTAMNVRALVAANSTWMELALSPSDARRIISQNKLAIVLATEVDDLGDHCGGDLSSTLPDDPMDHGTAISTQSSSDLVQGYWVWRWNEMRDRGAAASCVADADWKVRVHNLYKIGYRVIMPVHLADNALGGTAIYDTMFNTNTRFMTGSWIDAGLSSDVHYTFPQSLRFTGQWSGSEVGWLRFGASLSTIATYPAVVTYPYPSDNLTNMMAAGFVNTKPFSSSGNAVLEEAMEHGMIIDIAHLDQKGREMILGLGAYANRVNSPLNPGCDMSNLNCLQTAYPVVSTHAGLRDMQPPRDLTGGGPNEGALRLDMIQQIRDIGGVVGVGISAGDVLDTDVAAPGTWLGTNVQNVANSCGGSTRSFAQDYIYALRAMNGKGVTLGTDANGFEDRLNPRYGTQACYARGNIPWSYQESWAGDTLVDTFSTTPIRYRPAIVNTAFPSAGAQRANQMTTTPGLAYTHYSGPPSGVHFRGLPDPGGYYSSTLQSPANFNTITKGSMTVTSTSMLAVSTLPAITASTTGFRTFDYNYDGLAHYGMLPDMLQDSRVVGMTQEQLAPLFQGAESLVETWERSCTGAPWLPFHWCH